ncbi:transmembrane protein 200C isoform X2 [Tachysurus fulvidraco]|uniref:transmembrane protein 200C isoform X2 n=1 Tax=Tachysurus fulvidraco TaxID=1234273 RepID=UPI000F50923B|nr:transmembrane protein 200C isoform X2 [Tachysurus fulvidraco]
MIATGGLLRISRRQDSLRNKNRAENKRRRKARKKMKNNVVVVKGKLKLVSASGLVAAVGLIVLIVGITMAVLGYWPKQTSAYPKVFPREKQPIRQATDLKKNLRPGLNLTNNTKLWIKLHWNSSDGVINATKPNFRPVGYIEGVFTTYLYSDNLKVFGPLVMGIGIFLFICANAVLHENRDKKTKIIDLRDIYSTVIDIHSLRSKGHAPLNGLLGRTQSKEGDLTSATYKTAMPSRGSWPSTVSCKEKDYSRSSFARKFSWCRERQSLTEAIYTIYRDQNRLESKSQRKEPAPAPKEWETRSIVSSSVNAFTLPVIKLNNHEMEAREVHKAEHATPCSLADKLHPDCQGSGCSEELLSTAIQTKAEVLRAGLSVSRDSKLSSDVSSICQQQLQLPDSGFRILGSHLSLNALSDLGTARHEERSRRFSCPRLDRLGSKGYIKLAALGGDSFEAPDGAPETGVEGPEQAGTQSCIMNTHISPNNSITQLHIEPTISNSQTADTNMDPKTNLQQGEMV